MHSVSSLRYGRAEGVVAIAYIRLWSYLLNWYSLPLSGIIPCRLHSILIRSFPHGHAPVSHGWSRVFLFQAQSHLSSPSVSISHSRANFNTGGHAAGSCICVVHLICCHNCVWGVAHWAAVLGWKIGCGKYDKSWWLFKWSVLLHKGSRYQWILINFEGDLWLICEFTAQHSHSASLQCTRSTWEAAAVILKLSYRWWYYFFPFNCRLMSGWIIRITGSLCHGSSKKRGAGLNSICVCTVACMLSCTCVASTCVTTGCFA